MTQREKTAFHFDRKRGLVWVCDISESTRYLNDNKTANDIEEFIPRFHWTSLIIVTAAGGEFVKWTGDGFLAWFPIELHRDIGHWAATIFNASWHLSALVNITQLGINADRKFHIRHGITLEQDALLTRIRTEQGVQIELLGRGIVLAFRLLEAKRGEFPSIITQKALVDSARDCGFRSCEFKRWQLKANERLKYFKGEKWGTNSLYLSCKKRPRSMSTKGVIRKAKKAIRDLEAGSYEGPVGEEFISKFIDRMLTGPSWCEGVIRKWSRFIVEDVVSTVKKIIPLLDHKIDDLNNKPNDS